MPQVPVSTGGRTEIVHVDEFGERALALQQYFSSRQRLAAKRRLYYEGSQYYAENWDKALDCHIDPLTDRLPEHDKLHAYSTQIGECVDFIASQLSDGFRLKMADTAAQAVLDGAVRATEILNGGEADDALTVDDILREACVPGDVPYEVRWDPIAETAFVEFWENEQVEFDVPYGQTVAKVWRRNWIWVKDRTAPNLPDKQVLERVRYSLRKNERGIDECIREVFWDNEEDVKASEWLGMPVVPWFVLRADKRSLRGFRGDSLIKTQAMEAADRYNSVEQLSYIIARYNSHGNLVIIGDGAAVGLEADGLIHKDVADVLKFPGGTSASVITLPTDPQMIEHQREVLADSMYASFGLSRVEPATMQGLGQISGYALEILNRKSEGTFRRVRRTFRKDMIHMVNLILDVTAWRRDAVLAGVDESGQIVDIFGAEDVRADEFELPVGLLPVPMFEQIDPSEVFGNRKIDVQMPSGYIVDDVAVRDDFVSGMISRREALRKRGYSDPEITKIENEIGDETPEPVEETGSSGLTGEDLAAVLTGRNAPQAGEQSTERG